MLLAAARCLSFSSLDGRHDVLSSKYRRGYSFSAFTLNPIRKVFVGAVFCQVLSMPYLVFGGVIVICYLDFYLFFYPALKLFSHYLDKVIY